MKDQWYSIEYNNYTQLYVTSQDNGLGRIVGLYSKVSNDYVELQARHQQALEELAQERKKCKDDQHSKDEESRVCPVCNVRVCSSKFKFVVSRNQ